MIEAQARESLIEQICDGKTWDLVVVGGGILGAGIFNYAAQLACKQGLKVLLLEQKDFAWGSSSKSSKMVHGGLRYIAQGQIGLTRESVHERQILLQQAKGLVEPATYVMSHYQGKFPPKGLFNILMHMYGWFAGGRQHQSLGAIDYQMLVPGLEGATLQGGTQYVDALTDDARLVLRLIQQGRVQGGVAVNYAKVVGLLREQEAVRGVRVCLPQGQQEIEIHAKMVINATGAWSDMLDSQVLLRPLRGSHILIPNWRLPVANVMTLLHPRDKRPVMIYPWQNTTLVGTTDLDHADSLSKEPKMNQQELDYILEIIHAEFPHAKITKQDVISSYAGVRPIVLDKPINHQVSASDEKRVHSLFMQDGLVTVCGGKLTTFRVIAKEVLNKVAKTIGVKFPLDEFQLFDEVTLPEQLLTADGKMQYQLTGLYGKEVHVFNAFMQQVQAELSDFDLFKPIRYSNTCWAQLVFACQYEQVMHLDDLMLRRTRLGNVLPQGGVAELADIRQLCQRFLPWDDVRWEDEIERYLAIWHEFYSVPNDSQKEIVNE